MSMLLKNQINSSWLLYEGLIYSVSVNTVLDRIGHWLRFSDSFVLKKTETGKVVIKVTNPLSKEEWELFNKLTNNLGWYISSFVSMNQTIKRYPFKTIENMVNEQPRSIELEAKYDTELSPDMNTVYHTSPSKNDKKILKIGLVPRSKSKIAYHPERIYFIKKESDAVALIDIFQEMFNESFNLYKIDLKGALKKDGGIRIFNDPNLSGAFYTLSNIPPQFIKLVRTVK